MDDRVQLLDSAIQGVFRGDVASALAYDGADSLESLEILLELAVRLEQDEVAAALLSGHPQLRPNELQLRAMLREGMLRALQAAAPGLTREDVDPHLDLVLEQELWPAFRVLLEHDLVEEPEEIYEAVPLEVAQDYVRLELGTDNLLLAAIENDREDVARFLVQNTDSSQVVEERGLELAVSEESSLEFIRFLLDNTSLPRALPVQLAAQNMEVDRYVRMLKQRGYDLASFFASGYGYRQLMARELYQPEFAVPAILGAYSYGKSRLAAEIARLAGIDSRDLAVFRQRRPVVGRRADPEDDEEFLGWWP